MTNTVKLQLKLTQPAIERLVGGDAVLEAIISKQVLDNLAAEHSERLLRKITDRIERGLDLQGLSVLNVQISDKIRGVIASHVDNYLRVNAGELQVLVIREVEKQLPAAVRNAVQARMAVVSKNVLATLNAGK